MSKIDDKGAKRISQLEAADHLGVEPGEQVVMLTAESLLELIGTGYRVGLKAAEVALRGYADQIRQRAEAEGDQVADVDGFAAMTELQILYLTTLSDPEIVDVAAKGVVERRGNPAVLIDREKN